MELYERKSTKPLRAIKDFCGECMGMSRIKKNPPRPIEDIKNCTDLMCPLYDFRLGRNPYMRGKTKGNPNAFKNIERKARLQDEDQQKEKGG